MDRFVANNTHNQPTVRALPKIPEYSSEAKKKRDQKPCGQCCIEYIYLESEKCSGNSEEYKYLCIDATSVKSLSFDGIGPIQEITIDGKKPRLPQRITTSENCGKWADYLKAISDKQSSSDKKYDFTGEWTWDPTGYCTSDSCYPSGCEPNYVWNGTECVECVTTTTTTTTTTGDPTTTTAGPTTTGAPTTTTTTPEPIVSGCACLQLKGLTRGTSNKVEVINEDKTLCVPNIDSTWLDGKSTYRIDEGNGITALYSITNSKFYANESCETINCEEDYLGCCCRKFFPRNYDRNTINDRWTQAIDNVPSGLCFNSTYSIDPNMPEEFRFLDASETVWTPNTSCADIGCVTDPTQGPTTTTTPGPTTTTTTGGPTTTSSPTTTTTTLPPTSTTTTTTTGSPVNPCDMDLSGLGVETFAELCSFNITAISSEDCRNYMCAHCNDAGNNTPPVNMPSWKSYCCGLDPVPDAWTDECAGSGSGGGSPLGGLSYVYDYSLAKWVLK